MAPNRRGLSYHCSDDEHPEPTARTGAVPKHYHHASSRSGEGSGYVRVKSDEEAEHVDQQQHGQKFTFLEVKIIVQNSRDP